MTKKASMGYIKMKAVRALSTALLCVLVLAFAAAARADADEADNIGWVTEVSGSASILHAGRGSVEASPGAEVFLGDELSTGPGASVTLQFDDDSVLSLGAGTRVTLSEWVYDPSGRRNLSYFKLVAGRVRGLLKVHFGPDSSMSIETPDAVAGVKGSDISVWIEEGGSYAAVTEGTGFIRHMDRRFRERILLKAGMMARARRGHAIARPVRIPERVRRRILRLKARRHRELIRKLRHQRQERIKHRLQRKKHGAKERLKRRHRRLRHRRRRLTDR